MNRTQAIAHIRAGKSISNTFTGNESFEGREHTFRVSVGLGTHGEVKAVISCNLMRRLYNVRLTPKQLLSYIRRHYTRI